jgi:MYXO-CTERM domain-containing protein
MIKSKNLKAGVLALALAGAVPSLVHAQDTREPARTENERDGMDFGWLGLIGLAGLFGLKRREPEHDTFRDRDRVATNQVR